MDHLEKKNTKNDDDHSSDNTTCYTTDDFANLVTLMQCEYYPYIGGAAPRTIIPISSGEDIIFTANER